jgi:hypothetical protein
MALKIDLTKKFEKIVGQRKKVILNRIVNRLKEATPVDTGHARDSWRVEGSSIVNDVDYIGELNQGTSQQAPSHFIEAVVLSEPGVIPNGTIVVPKT